MRGEVKLARSLPMLNEILQPAGNVMDRKLKVVLALPGEAEMPLLTDLRTRDDVDIVAIVDPSGTSVMSALAEIMGLSVIPEIAAAQGVPGVVVVLPAAAGPEVDHLAVTAEALGLEVLREEGLRMRLAPAAVPIAPEPEPLADLAAPMPPAPTGGLAEAFPRLRALADAHESAADLLTAWTGELAATLGATRATLAIACTDGGLLLAESAAGEASRSWYEPLDDPAWQSVFGDGVPFTAQATDRDDLTVVYLPLGALPVRAGVALQWPAASLASDLTDHWPHLSGEFAALLAENLGRRVGDLRHARLLALCAALVDLATAERTPGQLAERVCQAAAELTGAQRTAAVVSIGGAGVRLAGGDAPDDAPWLAALPPLVAQASDQGWRTTTLEGDLPPLSILVASCAPGRQTPALVLVGKRRLHPLDGEGFTLDDADVAVSLAALLRGLPASGRDSAPPPLAAAQLGETPPPAGGEAGLIFALRREMSRCERYHNVFGLLVVRLAPTVGAVGLAARLAARLRTSDRVFDLGDGEIAVLAPEDVQNLDHFEGRLRDELNSLAGPPAAAAPIVRTVFPGPPTSPQDFLKRARRRD